MFGKKITVNFDTSILTPVAVVTKEPNPVYFLNRGVLRQQLEAYSLISL